MRLILSCKYYEDTSHNKLELYRVKFRYPNLHSKLLLDLTSYAAGRHSQGKPGVHQSRIKTRFITCCKSRFISLLNLEFSLIMPITLRSSNWCLAVTHFRKIIPKRRGCIYFTTKVGRTRTTATYIKSMFQQTKDVLKGWVLPLPYGSYPNLQSDTTLASKLPRPPNCQLSFCTCIFWLASLSFMISSNIV